VTLKTGVIKIQFPIAIAYLIYI